MDSAFVAMAGGWPPHSLSGVSRPTTLGHSRSLSSVVHSTPKSLRSATQSPSTTDVAALATGSSARRIFSSQSLDDNDLSTLPDPRSRAMSPANEEGSSSPRHPDLDDEVATLSTKLINAINHQTTLDDTLSATRMELEAAHERIRQLEAQVDSQKEMLAGDVWVRRQTVEAEKTKLLKRVVEEKNSRQEVEQQKKKIEQELENLTAALFEEANKMVISAKEEAKAEQEALQRKNDQLRSQLEDTEVLLKSQQEQLVELKQVMEQMSLERDDQTNPTVPSSPGFSKFDVRDEDGHSDGTSHPGLLEPLSPSYPTSFTHLLQPVLRTDLHAFSDFKELIRTSKRHSGRVVSGTFSLGSAASNASNASLPNTATPATSSPQTPNTPASSISTGSATSISALPPLKDTKFYKRALAEDIEPTLRLDTAPGLSWLARRTVLSAMTDGSLVVEPVPTTGAWSKLSKPEFYPCSLCGENRREDDHLRKHRFRTSESTSAQRYPLCKYCLTRVRSTCDFLGFLRIVKDGHWRADDEDAEKAAWEESVRLREQMFWSRIGGGVVPVGHGHAASSSVAASVRGEKSPRASHDELEVTATVEKCSSCATAEVDGELPTEGRSLGDANTALEGGAATQEPTMSTSKEQSGFSSSESDSIQALNASHENGENPKRLSVTIPSAPSA